MKILLKKKFFILAVFVFFSLILAMRSVRAGLPFFDIRLFYFPSDVQKILSSLGESGRQKYIIFNQLDFCFTIVYTYLLFFIYQKTLKEYANKLFIVPLALFIVDICENSCLFYSLRHFSNPRVNLDIALSILTPTKWFFALASILIVLNALLIRKYLK